MATRQGTVRLEFVDNSTIVLHNALFVPNLSTNLISFAQLVKEKAEIFSQEGQMIVKLNGKHCLKINTSQNIFRLEGAKIPPSVALATSVIAPTNTFLTWHQRLGHASAARIKVILGDQFPA